MPQVPGDSYLGRIKVDVMPEVMVGPTPYTYMYSCYVLVSAI